VERYNFLKKDNGSGNKLGEQVKSDDVCDIFNPDKQVVEMMKDKVLLEEVVRELSELFKVVADPTRIRILYALKERELCVCELSESLSMSSSAISHQLRILRAQKLVKYRKEGRSVYYSLDDDHVLSLFTQGLKHVMEDRNNG